MEQQFCALGVSAEQFLVGAAAIGNTRLSSELEVLLALGAAHGHEALVGALTRAVAFRRFRAADVRSIRAAAAGTRHPRPAGDALILDLSTAPTRSKYLRGEAAVQRAAGAVMTDTDTEAVARNSKTIAPQQVPELAVDLDAGLRRLKLAAIRRTHLKCY